MEDVYRNEAGGEGLVKYYVAQLAHGFEWKAIISILGATISVVEGFYGTILWAFLALFCLDLLTGILKSLLRGVAITSKRLRDSVVKLGGYMVLITALIITSKFETSFVAIATTAYYYFIFTELKSILENVGEMGVKVPQFLRAEIDQRVEANEQTIVKETPREKTIRNISQEQDTIPEENKIINKTVEEEVIITKDKREE